MMADEVTEATSVIEEMIRELLRERFKDEFEFGPIVVIPRFDDYYYDYLHSYIVFHGDQKKLDPIWTARLSGLLWARAEELGYPGIPIPLFVKRSEWPALTRSLE